MGHPERSGTLSRSVCDDGQAFELEMTGADDDWTGTRVGFLLEPEQGHTSVRFYHTG